MTIARYLPALVLIAGCTFAGCGQAPTLSKAEIKAREKKKELEAKEQELAKKAEQAKKKKVYWDERPENQKTAEKWKLEQAAIAAYDGSKFGNATTFAAGPGFTEAQAGERIEREVADALDVGPTIVVWLFDQSAASKSLRGVLTPAAARMPQRITAKIAEDKPKHKLLSAVVAYGSQVNVQTPEPTDDAGKLSAAVNITEDAQPSTQAYAAVAKAAELYAPFRSRGYEVIFVIVAQDAANDEPNFKKAIAALRSASVPVFGIGPTVPFTTAGNMAGTKSATPTESQQLERTNQPFFEGKSDNDLTDSGFGPFALERICRESDGKFLRIRHGGSPAWATDGDGEVKSELLKKYAPDYVSPEEYQTILSNKACAGVVKAAMLPPAKLLIASQMTFVKGDEAKMAQNLTAAQRASAECEPGLRKVHEALAEGTSDRNKLTSPRWQAEYDLAMGRALAARAHNDGYNFMLATLKNGKPFTNPSSSAWNLQPADGIAGSSQLDKMCKDSKIHLERVVKDHPGTPWAALAERALESKCGWEWMEQ